ncbi:MAG TPA: NAD(P)H-dependent oxidoreductase subunit E, partial [Ardenticatenaceae bacterium]|nr:NAD(P)H-dependent oxidoreductase subunit E [Ardenticatenaceae bacterium]
VQEILGRYPEKRAALMPLLYLAQDVYGGWLPPEAIQEVAAVTELEPTDVYAVSAFYSLYYHEPTGKYVLRFCTDMPCALVGADELFATLCAKLGVHDHGTTADGLFTVQSAVCLAACGLAPVMQINRQFFENLTEQQLDQLIASVRANGLPPDGPGLRFQPRDGA